MAYLTAWDASNKLYKRGSSDYPWCAGPRGHSRAQAHVVLSWWKEVDGRDPSPLPAVCPRLLSAGTPLGDYTVPPRSKSQYWNNHKDKHLPLKRARVFSPQAVVPQFFEEGGVGRLRVWSRMPASAHHVRTNKRPESLFFECNFRSCLYAHTLILCCVKT